MRHARRQLPSSLRDKAPAREGSQLEQRFKEILLAGRRLALPDPIPEFCFILAEPPEVQLRYVAPLTRLPRQWRFDFAWPTLRVAVELDGGYQAPGMGRHNSRGDHQKMAAAAELGWIVLHFTAPELRNSANVLMTVQAVLQSRGHHGER
jgi:hypothetical protein